MKHEIHYTVTIETSEKQDKKQKPFFILTVFFYFYTDFSRTLMTKIFRLSSNCILSVSSCECKL